LIDKVKVNFLKMIMKLRSKNFLKFLPG